MPALIPFHEVRFPTAIAFGASGGPERRTEIVALGSGHEERNSRWADSRRRYNAGYGVRSLDDLHAVIAFFEERRGQLYGFRWKDRADWKSCAPGATPAATDQAIGTGDGDSGRDTAYLRSNIAGGEYFDWYYASDADRDAQVRSAIGDGTYGKPWVFRPKDILSWWANEHHDRPGGVEAGTPTDWVPESKPIWFTETGCPAVDKGPNQPNVFPDPKSVDGGLPHYSSGARDDLVQRRFVAAVLAYWDPQDDGFDAAANPLSSVYGERMVDPASIHLWTWDARPYPAFPLLTEVWADGANWETGHWLNGRLGALTANALVAQILADYGVTSGAVGDLDGTVDGYLVAQVSSARDALELLSNLLAFEGAESGDTFRFVRRGRRAHETIAEADLVEEGSRPLVSIRRAQETELPAEIEARMRDIAAKAFRALGCDGMARVDFFVTADWRILVNELNTIPGFTDISMYSKVMAASGVGYAEIIDRLVAHGLARAARG